MRAAVRIGVVHGFLVYMALVLDSNSNFHGGGNGKVLASIQMPMAAMMQMGMMGPGMGMIGPSMMGPGMGMMQTWYDEWTWYDDGTLDILVASAANH